MKTVRLILMSLFVLSVASIASAQCLSCHSVGGPRPSYVGVCDDSGGNWCSGVCCGGWYGDPCTIPDWVYDCGWGFASLEKTSGFAPQRVDLAKIKAQRDRVFTSLVLMQLKSVEVNRRMNGTVSKHMFGNCGARRRGNAPIPRRV
jgi:hypothetical protein